MEIHPLVNQGIDLFQKGQLQATKTCWQQLIDQSKNPFTGKVRLIQSLFNLLLLEAIEWLISEWSKEDPNGTLSLASELGMHYWDKQAVNGAITLMRTEFLDNFLRVLQKSKAPADVPLEMVQIHKWAKDLDATFLIYAKGSKE